MKYHILVKFIAILLASVFLAAAAGSVIGVVALVGTGLYTQSVDALYDSNLQGSAHSLAVNIAHRYASLELGNIPESYWEAYEDHYWYNQAFDSAKYMYTIQDWQGNVLESTMDGDRSAEKTYTYEITELYYRQVVDLQVLSENEFPLSPGDYVTDETVVGYSAAEELYSECYYDAESGYTMQITYRHVMLGKCLVTIYLLDGAYEDEPYWDALRELYSFRYDIFWVLGISLLLFAACMVYLCFAAGRKPGSEELRVVGLNRIPLDLYLFCVIVGETALLIIGWEGVESLIVDYSTLAQYAAVLILGLCSAVAVIFLYGCIAQFKMKRGFWWRYSVIGWCLRMVRRGFLWLGKCCRALYRLLPVIGQWLLIAGGMGFVLLITYLLAFGSSYYRINGFFALIFFWEILVCIAAVCYCAYAFGILLKGAGTMAKGDLDTKIPTKYLYLSFRSMADEMNRLADAAKIAAEKQLKSERMKTELITNVSHDIKTPLTSIINYVDLMEKPHTQAEGEEYLAVLSRQSQRLKKLIDDLMDMSKASTGNLSVELTRLDAAETVNQTLGEFGDKLAAADLTSVVRLPETPVYILADGKLVWRIMSNLLGNAVKYALPGTRVYIDLSREAGKVLLSVKNISREELNVSADELAERFVRGDASRNTEGSGLGLNIARSLMELQKGKLELTVDGDLFKVTLIFPEAE